MSGSYFDYGLTTASFEDVEFPVAEAEVHEGNTLVEHVAKGRRGAVLEANQQRPSQGTLVIPLFNDPRMVRRWGTLVPNKLIELRAKFMESPIGRLFHPVYGFFRAGIKSWRVPPDASRRNGFLLTVEWVEDNGDAALFLEDARVSDRPSTALSALALIADALAIAAGTAAYTALASPFNAMITLVGEAAATPARIGAQIESSVATVEANLALYAAAEDWQSVAALESARAQLYALRRELLEKGSDRTYTVPFTMPLVEIAASVYGDSAQAPTLARANALTDPLAVPAGTVLTVPAV